MASSWCQQGKLQLQVNQICSKELAWWEQLEVRYAGKLKNYKKPCKNHCFLKARGAPRWAQEGSRNYLARFTRCAAHLFGPILGPSWAILGPSRGHLGPISDHLYAMFGHLQTFLGHLEGTWGYLLHKAGIFSHKLAMFNPLSSIMFPVFRIIEPLALNAAWRNARSD